MTSQQPGWQQPSPGYGPSAAYWPDGRPPEQPVPRRRKRWPFVVVGLVLAVALLLVGYSFLTYNRSVGAPPIADPVPEQCQVTGQLLASTGTPSWQGGPMRMSGKVRGVSCEWVAAESESVRQRRLAVVVDRHPSARAAKKELTTRRADLGPAATEQDGVGDQAVVGATDGSATLVARRGRVVVDVEFGGWDKGFFSGLFGDGTSTEVPAAEARELAIAVAQELLAPTR